MSTRTPLKPTAADRLTERSATRVRYVTAAGRAGLGTHSRLAPARDPIQGLYVLDLSEGAALQSLRVRLPAGQAQLGAVIMRQFEGGQGASRPLPSPKGPHGGI